jgi:CHAD domain-containing protein
MSYKLKAGEKLSRGIRRIERKQVERVSECLAEGCSGDRGHAVHQARKQIKKARAALRLIRDKLPANDYRTENGALRRVSREFSAVRDAEVALETVDKLRRDCHRQDARKVLGRLGQILKKRHQETLAQPPKVREIEEKLGLARRQIKSWSLGGLTWPDLICGGRQSYKKGRNAFQEAKALRSPESLHDWRKRVKDLGHQLRVLQPVQTPAEARYAHDIKRLGALLGEYHDLARLQKTASQAKLGPGCLRILEEEMGPQRKKLEDAAFKLGNRLYDRKPAAFARSIKHHGKRYRR